jgi:hypothetical protein
MVVLMLLRGGGSGGGGGGVLLFSRFTSKNHQVTEMDQTGTAESQAAPHPTDIAVAGLATPTPNCYTAVGASKYIAPVEVELLQGFLGNRLARTILRGGHIDLYLTATVVAWQPRKRPPAAV